MLGFRGNKMRYIPENAECLFLKQVQSLHLMNVELLSKKTSLGAVAGADSN